MATNGRDVDCLRGKWISWWQVTTHKENKCGNGARVLGSKGGK